MCDLFDRVRSLATVIFLIVCSVAVTGCSFIKTYPDSLPRNMHVIAEMDSGTAMVESAAKFDIYRVNAKCELQYEGRVFLDSGEFDVGIPTDGMVYLKFIFASKRGLSASTSGIRPGFLFTPRPGYGYQARVRHLHGIYSVAIREISADGSIDRELERLPLNACKVQQ